MPPHPPLCDVIIVGAGPGGSAAAHVLAQQGLDVLLLDKADFPRDKTCGDALTPRALAVLADMGLLDDYDGLLRQRFQRLFIFCNRLRDLFLNPLWLNRMVSAAAQRPDLKLLLTDIVLGNRDVAEGMSMRVVLKTFLALLLR